MGWAVRIGVPLAVAAAFLALWWIAVVASDTVIFPSPVQVAEGTLQLARDGTLWNHIGASFYRVALGFLLAMAIGIPLGLLMGWKSMAYVALNPVVQVLRPISPIAWIPIAILWFGVGDVAPIFLIFLSAVFPLVVQTAAGVPTIELQYLRAARNFGITRSRLFFHVVIPAVLPQIIIGMRVSLGISWLVVVAAEMVTLRSGLGYMIIDARNAGNRYDLVVAGMVIIGIAGLLLDLGMRRLERIKAVRWRYRDR